MGIGIGIGTVECVFNSCIICAMALWCYVYSIIRTSVQYTIDCIQYIGTSVTLVTFGTCGHHTTSVVD